MGAVTSIASGLGSVASTLGTVNTIVETVETLSGNSAEKQAQDLALRQLQDAQNLQQSQLAQQTALERQQLADAQAQEEKERKDALKRAVAAQRASYGASGVSSSGGSAQAVLLGMFDQTEDELEAARKSTALKNAALDLELEQSKALNVLQYSQLQQSQKLNDEIDSFSDLF